MIVTSVEYCAVFSLRISLFSISKRTADLLYASDDLYCDNAL